MWKQLFNQTGRLVGFILRRDRVQLPIWLLSFTVMTLLTASAFTGLYETEQERQVMAETMRNPAMTAMVGPGFGLDDYTEGAMMAHQMLLFTAVVVGIMSIMLVTRHTRADEEEGRIELIRSLPVGQLSTVSATIIVLVCANVVLALLIGFGLAAMGIESIDLHGSLLYGASLGATGILFTSITVMFAQVSGNPRGTIGLSFTILLLSYLLRAIGDINNETLSWLSPLGWITRTQAYVNNYWWPILLTVVVSLLLLAIAMYLTMIRDLDSGLIQPRPGRKHATRFLQSPIGLFLRLQRTSLIAWGIGMLLLGASYGSVLGDLESFIESNEMMKQMLQVQEGISLTEAYIPLLMAVVSMICTVPSLMFMLKMRGEEKKNHLEHLLARVVSRTKVMSGYLIISIVFGSLMLLLSFLGLWSAAIGVMVDPIAFLTLFKATVVYLPAMWLMIGVSVLLVGLYPKKSGLVWVYLGYSFFVVYLGGMLQLPEWLGKLSPFGHIPKIPVEEMNVVSLVMITGLAICLMIIGLIGFRNRDLIE